MSNRFKLFIMFLMSLALFFGFLNLFVPLKEYNLDRLHIFLFNLCSGGAIILYFTQGQREPSLRVIGFLFLTIAYTVFAFFKIYFPVLIITILLFGVVESIRIERFSFFPYDFFKRDVPVSSKFHQASLLCLSLGLVISGLVIINNIYTQWFTLPKLKLDTFFLGFSFPLSLITLSLIFSIMKDNGKLILYLKNLAFWAINLGVIIFFLFIIFQRLIPQLVVTLILFATVVMVFHLFVTLGRQLQQKTFLVSGIGFLLMTAVTGILYIIFEFLPYYSPEKYRWLLQIHTFVSLYGWNLCGLAIICRYHDFPIRLHSTPLIMLHWVTVLLLAPLGCYFRPFAILATLCYVGILYVILFSKGNRRIADAPQAQGMTSPAPAAS